MSFFSGARMKDQLLCGIIDALNDKPKAAKKPEIGIKSLNTKLAS
ncbi:hypothetical protein [Celeribacter baekdonensis]|nr:hypothetical protein [Celeribacter baekdonensis]